MTRAYTNNGFPASSTSLQVVATNVLKSEPSLKGLTHTQRLNIAERIVELSGVLSVEVEQKGGGKP